MIFPEDKIDHAQFNELVSEGGLEFFEEMVELYEAHIPNIIVELREAAKSENRHQIQELAHSIKGSSANIGAKIVTDLTREIESKCADLAMDELQKLCAIVQPTFDDALTALKSLTKNKG